MQSLVKFGAKLGLKAAMVSTAAGLALTAVLLLPTGAQGQGKAFKAPRTKDGKPNLNGIWQSMSGANWNIEPHGASMPVEPKLGAMFAVPPGLGVVVGGEIPYKPEARQKQQANFADRLNKDGENKCYMVGVPRANYMDNQPFQIIQGDKDIMIAYQYAGAVRVVNMGKPTEAPADSWMGWSNGHWEGETLVIDVTSQNGDTWYDRAGNHHSNKVHVVERYTMRSPDVLTYEATIEDPETLTKPFVIRMPLYRRLEEGAQLLEYKCVTFAEEFLYGHLRKGAQTDAKGKSK